VVVVAGEADGDTPVNSGTSTAEENPVPEDEGITVMREHNRVIGDLERLVQTRAQDNPPHGPETQRDLELKARVDLFTAMESSGKLDRFRERHDLTENETMILQTHVQFCQELNDGVRWDLISRILFDPKV